LQPTPCQIIASSVRLHVPTDRLTVIAEYSLMEARMTKDDLLAKGLTEKDIHRRIDFLLNEARSPHPVRDQAIIFTMRVISNFYSIGKDSSSSKITLLSKRMSREALHLKERVTLDE
jgi:hypothetical protein